MKNNWMFTIVLMAVLNANGQSVSAVKVNVPQTAGFPATISFYCSQSYDRNACVKDIVTLRKTLAAYPVERLGQWTMVLVASDEWNSLKRSMGGDPISPAFTVLDNRTTVMEQALFSGSAAREAELFKQFGTMRDGILELAVTHELGHTICSETDERRADDYGRILRERKRLACEPPKLRSKAR